MESLNDPAVKKGFVKDRLRAITEMRKKLLEILVQQAGNKNMLTHKYFTGSVENFEFAKGKMCKDAVKEKGGCCKKILLIFGLAVILIAWLILVFSNRFKK